MINGKRKARFQAVMAGFKEQYSDSVKKNVKIKRRYDEWVNKLRREDERSGKD